MKLYKVVKADEGQSLQDFKSNFGSKKIWGKSPKFHISVINNAPLASVSMYYRDGAVYESSIGYLPNTDKYEGLVWRDRHGKLDKLFRTYHNSISECIKDLDKWYKDFQTRMGTGDKELVQNFKKNISGLKVGGLSSPKINNDLNNGYVSAVYSGDDFKATLIWAVELDTYSVDLIIKGNWFNVSLSDTAKQAVDKINAVLKKEL